MTAPGIITAIAFSAAGIVAAAALHVRSAARPPAAGRAPRPVSGRSRSDKGSSAPLASPGRGDVDQEARSAECATGIDESARQTRAAVEGVDVAEPAS